MRYLVLCKVGNFDHIFTTTHRRWYTANLFAAYLRSVGIDVVCIIKVTH